MQILKNFYILSEEWIYKNHNLTTTEERAYARNMIYECAKNFSEHGYPSYYHCFDSEGQYNHARWGPYTQKVWIHILV